MLDVEAIRRDFPILRSVVNGKPLIYVDNAATTQKPQAVIDAISDLYQHHNANIHRGVHALSQQATALYEGARETVRGFINARHSREIVFVRGATEGINLVASSYLAPLLHAGDEILISEMEHHSNIIPWQILAQRHNAKLKIIPLKQNGELDLDQIDQLLEGSVKLVAVTQMSNSLGTINELSRIITAAHAREIPVLVDGAQSVAHLPINVQQMDCDFFVFSGHKVYGPTGIGVLYAKENLLKNMPPYQSGGDMILTVTFAKTEYNEIPHKFEAGTPDIAGAIGLAAALNYVSNLGIDRIGSYERDLLQYATERLASVPGLRIIGEAVNKGSIISVILEGIHPHDVGTIMDMDGIAVRTGHHCTQPVMECFHVPATTRASFAFYNTRAEVDEIVASIHRVKELMG